jgi:transposase
VFQVAAKSVWRWVDAFDRNGNRALKAGVRGRRLGEQKALTPRQQARLRRAVLGRYPDQLALPGWCRPARRSGSWCAAGTGSACRG